MNWWEVGVVVIAVGFVVLVYFLVRTLQAAQESLRETNRTLQKVQNDLTVLKEETVRLVKTSEEVTNDIHAKLRTLDPLCQSIGHTGEALQQVTNTVRQVSSAVTSSTRNSTTREQGKVSSTPRLMDLIEWTAAGAQMWYAWRQQIKARKAHIVDEKER
ncbi:DUF948 domain-containing protein [Paenibacillus senegalensis]|uniref:DUF948 domain-containing protein n=1 Tax=Paenibacillus senegalensis TaxID=1465766 RepID=UPI00028A38DC|nr:DUF948 domain-containing protein [Paenibacillus senegalensis]